MTTDNLLRRGCVAAGLHKRGQSWLMMDPEEWIASGEPREWMLHELHPALPTYVADRLLDAAGVDSLRLYRGATKAWSAKFYRGGFESFWGDAQPTRSLAVIAAVLPLLEES